MQMTDAEQLPRQLTLFRRIDEAIDSGQMTQALRLILTNFARLSDTAPLRERVALALATRGRKADAAALYELLARHHAMSGNPARCLAIIKQLDALGQPTEPLRELFASLYNIRSEHLTDQPPVSDLGEVEAHLDLSAKEPQVGEAELLQLAHERAGQKRGLVTQPQALGGLPLLSMLPEDALRRVIDLITYEIVPQRQTLIARDAFSEDLLWTVSPTAMLREGQEVFRLPCGALLGLNGFGRPRVPSQVSIESHPGAELLRLSASAIHTLSEQLPDFPNRLATLRRHALTEQLLCRHPMFVDLEPDARVALMERFIGVQIDKGEYLSKQGQTSPGLFIILDGQVDVVRQDDSWEITIATLQAGDIFGEIGLLSDSPATAGVVSTTPGILLMLSREDFAESTRTHPHVARYAASLAKLRLEEIDTTLSASDLAEID